MPRLFQNFSFERAARKNCKGLCAGPQVRTNRVLQEALPCVFFSIIGGLAEKFFAEQKTLKRRGGQNKNIRREEKSGNGPPLLILILDGVYRPVPGKHCFGEDGLGFLEELFQVVFGVPGAVVD